MFLHRRRPFDPDQAPPATPELVAMNRRRFLTRLGISAAIAGAVGYAGWRWQRGDDGAILAAGGRPKLSPQLAQRFPARRSDRFQWGRPMTSEVEAARYTNFYEFSVLKSVWRFVEPFQPDPWTITIDGLCRQPQTLSIEDLVRQHAAAHEERLYRHRCVETWAMAVPWSGIPLADVIRAADPLPSATHVRFVSFHRPQEASRASTSDEPWPYVEGLTLAEAMNPLPLLATGMYGHALLKQHGAPLRLVVPWKYGYKSIKSIQRIELVDHEPTTFWTTLFPQAYPFRSNVDPAVPHPKWSQQTEWMLGTNERHPTQPYNGYGEYVAGLYAG